MPALYETERPRSFSEMAGHRSAMRKLLCLDKTTGLAGQVYWITGESGTGKTTLAKIIASHVAESITTHEIDASKLTTEALDEWEHKASVPCLFGGYAFIVNEAHTLSSRIVSRLQTVLEDTAVQDGSTWIFTTTNDGERKLFDTKFDACPFLSRAVSLKLELDDATKLAMAKRLRQIAEKHDVGGRPDADYLVLLEGAKWNMRMAIQKIATGEMMA